MNHQYKCSLFCSFYKGQKFIKEYLENVLEQSIFDNIEFVFLDCNSPENEAESIEPYVSKFKNIKYYRLDSDPGLYAGWNHAIKLCNANIIGNWNIDDRKNKDGIELMLKKFEHDPSIDIVYGITYVSRIANEKYYDNSFNEIYPVLPHSLENLIRHNSPHCMPLWRKNLHNVFGYFDESYKTAADGDFWLRCASGGATIRMVNHPVGLYYENPTGRSTNPQTLKEMIEEVADMRRKYLHYLK
jgi:glycosyltransferase involved in cell wall biosynthesis